jgi:hypothetical protein
MEEESMTQEAQRFPLSWPSGWKRTPAGARRRGRFTKRDTVYSSHVDAQGRRTSWQQSKPLSVSDAIFKRLLPELSRLGVRDGDIIVSSNMPTRLDGLPYSNAKEPSDPGVAVYFQMGKKPRVLACDTWDRVADNLAAVAAHIEAIRAIDRYGVGTIEQAFAGYAALPAQASPWWTVLEFETRPASWEDVKARHTRLWQKHHPDAGGNHDTIAKINAARDAAKIDLGVQ